MHTWIFDFDNILSGVGVRSTKKKKKAERVPFCRMFLAF